MANGTQHYDEAEVHLAAVDNEAGLSDDNEFALAKAQVHATLALAGALAALIGLTNRGKPVLVKHSSGLDRL